MMVSYGAQLKSEKELTEIREFQFTHPHGVRHLARCTEPTLIGFNPRTHMGCDRIFNKCLNITVQRYEFCERKPK